MTNNRFEDAIRAAGIHVKGGVIADGMVHRAPAGNDRAGTKSGWYVLSPDGQTGVFGQWKGLENNRQFWSEKNGTALSQDERAALEERYRAMADAARQEKANTQNRVAELARSIWRDSPQAETHPYLEKKGLDAEGLRMTTKNWNIPLRDQPGKFQSVPIGALLIPVYAPVMNGAESKLVLRSLEFIKPDGSKSFLAGGQKQGCFTMIGTPYFSDEAGTVIVASEGYATGKSVHMATGYPVAVAFDAGNMKPVMQTLRARYPEALLVAAGDNDLENVDLDGNPTNPGVKAATAAADAVGGIAAIPHALESGGKLVNTDWDDVRRAEGVDMVCHYIEKKIAGTDFQALMEQRRNLQQPGQTSAPASGVSQNQLGRGGL